MKTTTILVLVAGFTAILNVQAQGLVTFRNAPSSAVIDGRYEMPIAGGIAVAGLYYTTDLGAVPDLWSPRDSFRLAAVTPIVGSFGGGVYSGGTVAIPDVPGATQVLLQVRGWGATYASYEEAWLASDPVIGWCPPGSNVMTVTLARPGTTDPVPSIATMVEGFRVYCVPEPSTLVLGLLASLGALAFWRRG